MIFSGELLDCRPGDVLKTLAEAGESGKLRLSHRQDEAVVLFNQGRALYAATSTVRETLGSILIAQGHIDRDQLETALEVQQAADDKRLGAILVEAGMISDEIVVSAIREQIGGALGDLLKWRGGHYDFQPLFPVANERASVDILDLLPEDELSPAEVGERLRVQLEGASRDQVGADDPGSRLALLKRTATEIRSPQFTGELVVKILDFARQTVRRAVLFLVRPDGFRGIGHVGVEIPGVHVNQAIRELSIPLDRPSLLLEAADRQEAVLRPITEDGRDSAIIEGLGGGVPESALAVPMVVSEQVMTVLYVDNLPSNEPLFPVDELELLMIQAGMSIEKNLYLKRLKQYETLRDLDPDQEIGS